MSDDDWFTSWQRWFNEAIETLPVADLITETNRRLREHLRLLDESRPDQQTDST